MYRIIEELKEKNILVNSLVYSIREREKEREFEKLQFIGDKILGCEVSTKLYDMFSFADNKILNEEYRNVINNASSIAKQLKIDRVLKFNGTLTDNMLADSVEAILGELYLKNKKIELDKIVDYMIFKGLKSK
ncbi:ribonuclease III domain-containing protein [Hathewaya limosa]|uniref:DsRNA-specific ribonuclease n=1 Tax=Hathewaya limosa TaxID=1536 RepID=A0ABU0JTX1_HATLI|nr:ribonuclease III domain-containing protein [Hathewaya limosa]AWZ48900.1 hypothetical protein C3495_08785 [Clostridiaceae bacterium 14S0207]MDQ0479588.1 dsRNA-specific ribonuclease [Hathewaya limosa]